MAAASYGVDLHETVQHLLRAFSLPRASSEEVTMRLVAAVTWAMLLLFLGAVPSRAETLLPLADGASRFADSAKYSATVVPFVESEKAAITETGHEADKPDRGSPARSSTVLPENVEPSSSPQR
jgi:hypothetical protein